MPKDFGSKIIRLRPDTNRRLAQITNPGVAYDSTISKLLDFAEGEAISRGIL